MQPGDSREKIPYSIPYLGSSVEPPSWPEAHGRLQRIDFSLDSILGKPLAHSRSLSHVLLNLYLGSSLEPPGSLRQAGRLQGADFFLNHLSGELSGASKLP